MAMPEPPGPSKEGILMASAKEAPKPKAGAKTKSAANTEVIDKVESGAEFWARAVIHPKDRLEFLRRVDQAESVLVDGGPKLRRGGSVVAV